METSPQPISIESFSYSWLVNLKPSLETLDMAAAVSSDESISSFIEMDPRLPPSKRFIRNSHDFKFDFPNSESPNTLLHADELFSNGYVMPLTTDPSLKMESYDSSNSNQLTALKVTGNAKNRNSSVKRSRKLLSKRLFQKYLDFLRPLYRRIKGCGSSSNIIRGEKSVGNNNRRVHVMDSWVCNSAETSPRVSVAYSGDDWRRSCDSESSIYEAVLHCKRSIGK